MAKKNNKPTASKNSSESVITLDAQAFLTPVSILLGSIFISLALFLGLLSIDVNYGDKVSESKAGTQEVAKPSEDVPQEAPDTAQPEFPDATTSIDDDAILGNKDSAKVAIVEFSDYECPFCKRYYTDTYAELKSKYVDSGDAIIVFRDFPLSFHDPLATKEAIGAECAKDIGGDSKYYEYHDLIFDNTNSNGSGLAESKLYDFASQIGLNSGKFKDCLDNEKFADEIKKDIEDGTAAGVQGTPGFVIGRLNDNGEVEGKLIAGAYPFAEFEKIIEEYLAG